MIPGLGRSPGEGKGYPLQYSGLENSMDYIYIVREVAKSQAWLSGFHFYFFHGMPGCFAWWLCHFIDPLAIYVDSNFLMFLPMFIIFPFSDYSHPSRCKMMYHVMFGIVSHAYWSVAYFLWRNVFSSPLLILKIEWFIFLLLGLGVLYMLLILSPYQIHDLQIFSSIL